MSQACKNCGRNTATIAAPLEWKDHLFCSPACLASYQGASGVSKKNRISPTPKQPLLHIYRELPVELKIVIWLNIIPSAINLVSSLPHLATAASRDQIQIAMDTLLAILIVVGILQASRFIRIMVLVFSWIAVVSAGIGLIPGMLYMGLGSLMLLLPIAISGTTIWGLNTQRAKTHFGY